MKASDLAFLISGLWQLSYPGFDLPAYLTTPAAEAKVILAVKADREQPSAGPVVVEITVTNRGKKSVVWWNGGPGAFLKDADFSVQARASAERKFHPVKATNGQYYGPSNFAIELPPGVSVVVPLALQTHGEGALRLRIGTANWPRTKPVECTVLLRKGPAFVARRRALTLAGTLEQKSSFWRHVIEEYPDAAVGETLLKRAGEDDPEARRCSGPGSRSIEATAG